jgi:dihydroceramide fatty acyl 2-hydroxylase
MSMSRRSAALQQSPPLFSSQVLDRLTRTRPAVLPFIWAPVIIGLVVFGAGRMPIQYDVPLFIFGWLLWTAVEYALHRWLFHWEPASEGGRRFHFVLHGVHHERPSDPLRVVFPPVAGLPLACVFFVAFRCAFGAQAWPMIAAGFIAGYLAFDLIHAYVHTRKPSGLLGRVLRERHMRHHFRDGDKNFGVSSALWDFVMRTRSRR